MKYKVSISYISTTFDDDKEAMDFAKKAKLHADNAETVTIKLIDDEKEAEA